MISNESYQAFGLPICTLVLRNFFAAIPKAIGESYDQAKILFWEVGIIRYALRSTARLSPSDLQPLIQTHDGGIR